MVFLSLAVFVAGLLAGLVALLLGFSPQMTDSLRFILSFVLLFFLSFCLFRYAQKKADELKAESLQLAIDTVHKLQTKLSDFAQKHQKELRNDPVFRQRFLDMCAPLGIDPLASQKSVWNRLLGMGDFYHELAVKVAEVCLAHRSTNGGIMSVSEVQSILQSRSHRNRSGSASKDVPQVSPSDILVAVSKLAKLGGGFRTVTVGKSVLIVSVPTELDHDHVQVLAVAQATPRNGITIRQIRDALPGWSQDRADRAATLLLREGMAWLDEHRGETYYWFPSLWQEQQEAGGTASALL